MGISQRECELASKLLQTLHLSVAERAELPGGKLRFSTLLTAARADLARTGFLPAVLRPDDDYHGVVIELRDDSYWIHERAESGVGRFGPRSSRKAESLREAVRAYLRAHGEPSIDGVPIDFDDDVVVRSAE